MPIKKFLTQKKKNRHSNYSQTTQSSESWSVNHALASSAPPKLTLIQPGARSQPRSRSETMPPRTRSPLPRPSTTPWIATRMPVATRKRWIMTWWRLLSRTQTRATLTNPFRIMRTNTSRNLRPGLSLRRRYSKTVGLNILLLEYF